MSSIGYVIARPSDDARYGMVLTYLAAGDRWVRGTLGADGTGQRIPREARIWRDDEWCDAPEDRGTDRYGRLAVDVELDHQRIRFHDAFRVAARPAPPIGGDSP